MASTPKTTLRRQHDLWLGALEGGNVARRGAKAALDPLGLFNSGKVL